MNPRVEKVKAHVDFTLALVFKNKEQRVFDMKPYLNTGVYKRLNNLILFLNARVQHGTVVWDNELDFDPDTLYLESKSTLEILS